MSVWNRQKRIYCLVWWLKEEISRILTHRDQIYKTVVYCILVKHQISNLYFLSHSAAISSDPAVWTKFRSGFCECANEVRRYLSKMEGVDSGLKQRLLNYLNICMNCMNSLPSPNMSTFLPSLSGIMPQFHPLAMQLAASIQGFKPEMGLSDNQATEAGKMFGAALLQGQLKNNDIANMLPSSTGTLSTNIPEDLSNKLPVQREALSSPPSFRISMESLVSPSLRSLYSDGRASSSEGSFKSPGTSASTSSEKEFSPRKVNLNNSPTQLIFKFPTSGQNIQKPIPKHASVNPVREFLPVASSSADDRQSCDSGSEDEPVWRPWWQWL